MEEVNQWHRCVPKDEFLVVLTKENVTECGIIRTVSSRHIDLTLIRVVYISQFTLNTGESILFQAE